MLEYLLPIDADKIDIVVEYFYALGFFPAILPSHSDVGEFTSSRAHDAVIVGQDEYASII